MLRYGGDGVGRVRMPVGPAATVGFDADAAWAELHTRLRAFVARRVADPHAADDLAQDILLRIHASMGELREGDRLDAWAYRIARNVITDHYRSRAASRETPTGDDLEGLHRSAGVDEQDDDGDQVRAEIAGCLAPMVRRLPEPYRQALEMTDLGELTQAAAAEHLGLSVPGMKARVQRGRVKLAVMLRDCCIVATDRRGRPTEYEANAGGCGCGSGATSTGCGPVAE